MSIPDPQDYRDFLFNGMVAAEVAGKWKAAHDLWALLDPEALPPRFPGSPRWDRGSKRLFLGKAAHEFPRTAPEQFAALDALESAGWPRGGDTVTVGPLERGKMKNAVANLHKTLFPLGLSLTQHKTGENGLHIDWHLDDG
jgi:hypothetical protein